MVVAIIGAIGAIICLALGVLFPWMKGPIIVGLAYGLAALGVTVLMRGGQVSFGHAMFACIAGYTTALLAKAFPGLDALFLILGGVAAALFAGAIVGLFVVRYREIFFGMLNLALSMVLYSVLGKFYEITGGTDGLRVERPPIAGFVLDRATYETALLVVALAASLAFGWLVQRFFGSATGEALAAIKTNETRLEYLGLSARRILWNGYLLSAGLCGLSGSLFVLLQGLVTPELGYWVRSGEFVFIAILGGSTHALGAFIGAVVFQVIQLVGTVFLSGAWKLLLGATLIAVILIAPAGITGALPILRGQKGGGRTRLQSASEQR